MAIIYQPEYFFFSLICNFEGLQKGRCEVDMKSELVWDKMASTEDVYFGRVHLSYPLCLPLCSYTF